ncbi:unnamed protein product [Acanthosepion pharaonis]|uniref:Uncharacterized protein n=1 Tax=Acanthosepion pharaonis TaxID=158019 RepID=A0A812C1P1_ACAPH|nr:unnamed protein product [Sepia pharaonis]
MRGTVSFSQFSLSSHLPPQCSSLLTHFSLYMFSFTLPKPKLLPIIFLSAFCLSVNTAHIRQSNLGSHPPIQSRLTSADPSTPVHVRWLIYLVHIYLSIYFRSYLSPFISIYFHSYLSTYLFPFISIYLSISVHIYLSISLSIYLSIYFCSYLSSINIPITLSLSLSLSLSLLFSPPSFYSSTLSASLLFPSLFLYLLSQFLFLPHFPSLSHLFYFPLLLSFMEKPCKTFIIWTRMNLRPSNSLLLPHLSSSPYSTTSLLFFVAVVVLFLLMSGGMPRIWLP